jgi:protein PhnA
MMTNDDEYVYDEETGEWVTAGQLRSKKAEAAKADEVVVLDSVGNVLACPPSAFVRQSGVI